MKFASALVLIMQQRSQRSSVRGRRTHIIIMTKITIWAGMGSNYGIQLAPPRTHCGHAATLNVVA